MKKIALIKDTLDTIELFHTKCTGCMLCTTYCSFHTNNNTNPKEHSKYILDNPCDKNVIKSSYDCNACGFCIVKCPENIDFRILHEKIKKNIYLNDHQLVSKSADRIVNFHQKNSFSRVFSHKTSGFTDQKNRKVFFPGCSLVSCSPKTVLNTYKYLQSKDDNIGIMSYCCGKPTEALGNEEGFERRFEIIKNEVRNSHITEIITACPNCHIVLKSKLPNTKVVHISQSILEYGFPSEMIDFYFKITKSRITIHDPCPIRDDNEIHGYIRKLAKLLGFKIEERDNSKENTLCCGAGGMIKLTSPVTAEKYSFIVLNEFMKNDIIITYCQECVETLATSSSYVFHLLDLIFNDYNSIKSKFININFFMKWANRYMHKIRINQKKGLFK